MTTSELVFLITGIIFIVLGVGLTILKIVKNLRDIRQENVTLKEANIGGIAGIWSFTKRHFLMFSIIVCFVLSFACFMGFFYGT